MKARKLDKNQQLAVDCDSNVVVSAGAGAGKTTVLSERYFRLISEARAGVENILTLTFTRKAAAEMKERIYQRLLNSDSPVVISQAAEFDKAKISTLDSFSSQIVRNGSEGFGVSSDFVSDNEGAITIAEETALDFLLRKQNDRYLQEFIYLHGFDLVYNGMFVPLAVNEFNISDPVNFEELLKKQKSALKIVYEENLKELEKIRTDILGLSPDIGKVMASNISSCETMGNLKNFGEDFGKNIVVGFLEKAEKIKFKKGTSKHPETQLLNEFIDNWRSLFAITESVANGIVSFPFLEGMFHLLEEFQDLFLTRKRISGILTFQDVSKMAVSILKEDINLRNFYKKEFKYIMIDEFQDNNLMQKELLYLLSEKNELAGNGIPEASELEQDKLFFVGDEKQSIYRFRGADVSVFKGLSKELISSGGKALTLGTNYRSEPDLIIFFNRIFEIVMKEADEPFEAEFESLGYRNPVSGVSPEISIFYKPESIADGNYLDNNEAEAWYIAKYIKDKVETKSLMISKKGSLVSAGYDDFAILMRSTSNQIMYEKYFRKLNIPCTVQGVRALFMEAPVNDIYNLLQLLVYPEDRVSYAALLRSPFVNISDDVSAAILLDRRAAFDLVDITELDGISIRKDDITKYNNARDLYIKLSSDVDFIPVADLIRVIWYEGGYRHYLMSNPEYHGYLEYYDYLKTLAVRSDERGECLAVFLDFIRANLGKYEKLPDLELLRDETKGVQILTIHKSKGLEFPVVIVANTGNTGRPGGSTPYYISDDFGITLKYENRSGGKANYFYDHAKELEDQKDLAENKRILYVAMTRAQSHLIISGSHNSKSGNPESLTGKKVLLNMVLKGLDWDGDPHSLSSEIFKKYIKIIPDVTEKEINSVKGHHANIDPNKIRSDYENCDIIERTAKRDTWSVSEINSRFAEASNQDKSDSKRLATVESDSFLTEDYYAAFGTYCHRIIEANLKNKEAVGPVPVEFSTLHKNQKKILEFDGKKLAEFFFNSYLFKANMDTSFESELAFILNIGNTENPVYVNGQIDLLFEKEDEILIIDFKTNKFKNKDEYAVQMFLYRKAAKEIYNKPAKSFLFYLREGMETEVSDDFSEFDIYKLLE